MQVDEFDTFSLAIKLSKSVRTALGKIPEPHRVIPRANPAELLVRQLAKFDHLFISGDPEMLSLSSAELLEASICLRKLLAAASDFDLFQSRYLLLLSQTLVDNLVIFSGSNLRDEESHILQSALEVAVVASSRAIECFAKHGKLSLDDVIAFKDLLQGHPSKPMFCAQIPSFYDVSFPEGFVIEETQMPKGPIEIPVVKVKSGDTESVPVQQIVGKVKTPDSLHFILAKIMNGPQTLLEMLEYAIEHLHSASSAQTFRDSIRMISSFCAILRSTLESTGDRLDRTDAARIGGKWIEAVALASNLIFQPGALSDTCLDECTLFDSDESRVLSFLLVLTELPESSVMRKQYKMFGDLIFISELYLAGFPTNIVFRNIWKEKLGKDILSPIVLKLVMMMNFTNNACLTTTALFDELFHDGQLVFQTLRDDLVVRCCGSEYVLRNSDFLGDQFRSIVFNSKKYDFMQRIRFAFVLIKFTDSDWREMGFEDVPHILNSLSGLADVFLDHKISLGLDESQYAAIRGIFSDLVYFACTETDVSSSFTLDFCSAVSPFVSRLLDNPNFPVNQALMGAFDPSCVTENLFLKGSLFLAGRILGKKIDFSYVQMVVRFVCNQILLGQSESNASSLFSSLGLFFKIVIVHSDRSLKLSILDSFLKFLSDFVSNQASSEFGTFSIMGLFFVTHFIDLMLLNLKEIQIAVVETDCYCGGMHEFTDVSDCNIFTESGASLAFSRNNLQLYDVAQSSNIDLIPLLRNLSSFMKSRMTSSSLNALPLYFGILRILERVQNKDCISKSLGECGVIPFDSPMFCLSVLCEIFDFKKLASMARLERHVLQFDELTEFILRVNEEKNLAPMWWIHHSLSYLRCLICEEMNVLCALSSNNIQEVGNFMKIVIDRCLTLIPIYAELYKTASFERFCTGYGHECKGRSELEECFNLLSYSSQSRFESMGLDFYSDNPGEPFSPPSFEFCISLIREGQDYVQLDEFNPFDFKIAMKDALANLVAVLKTASSSVFYVKLLGDIFRHQKRAIASTIGPLLLSTFFDFLVPLLPSNVDEIFEGTVYTKIPRRILRHYRFISFTKANQLFLTKDQRYVFSSDFENSFSFLQSEILMLFHHHFDSTAEEEQFPSMMEICKLALSLNPTSFRSFDSQKDFMGDFLEDVTSRNVLVNNTFLDIRSQIISYLIAPENEYILDNFLDWEVLSSTRLRFLKDLLLWSLSDMKLQTFPDRILSVMLRQLTVERPLAESFLDSWSKLSVLLFCAAYTGKTIKVISTLIDYLQKFPSNNTIHTYVFNALRVAFRNGISQSDISSYSNDVWKRDYPALLLLCSSEHLFSNEDGAGEFETEDSTFICVSCGAKQSKVCDICIATAVFGHHNHHIRMLENSPDHQKLRELRSDTLPIDEKCDLECTTLCDFFRMTVAAELSFGGIETRSLVLSFPKRIVDLSYDQKTKNPFYRRDGNLTVAKYPPTSETHFFSLKKATMEKLSLGSSPLVEFISSTAFFLLTGKNLRIFELPNTESQEKSLLTEITQSMKFVATSVLPCPSNPYLFIARNRLQCALWYFDLRNRCVHEKIIHLHLPMLQEAMSTRIQIQCVQWVPNSASIVMVATNLFINFYDIDSDFMSPALRLNFPENALISNASFANSNNSLSLLVFTSQKKIFLVEDFLFKLEFSNEPISVTHSLDAPFFRKDARVNSIFYHDKLHTLIYFENDTDLRVVRLSDDLRTIVDKFEFSNALGGYSMLTAVEWRSLSEVDNCIFYPFKTGIFVLEAFQNSVEFHVMRFDHEHEHVRIADEAFVPFSIQSNVDERLFGFFSLNGLYTLHLKQNGFLTKKAKQDASFRVSPVPNSASTCLTLSVPNPYHLLHAQKLSSIKVLSERLETQIIIDVSSQKKEDHYIIGMRLKLSESKDHYNVDFEVPAIGFLSKDIPSGSTCDLVLSLHQASRVFKNGNKFQARISDPLGRKLSDILDDITLFMLSPEQFQSAASKTLSNHRRSSVDCIDEWKDDADADSSISAIVESVQFLRKQNLFRLSEEELYQLEAIAPFYILDYSFFEYRYYPFMMHAFCKGHFDLDLPFSFKRAIFFNLVFRTSKIMEESIFVEEIFVSPLFLKPFIKACRFFLVDNQCSSPGFSEIVKAAVSMSILCSFGLDDELELPHQIDTVMQFVFDALNARSSRVSLNSFQTIVQSLLEPSASVFYRRNKFILSSLKTGKGAVQDPSKFRKKVCSLCTFPITSEHRWRCLHEDCTLLDLCENCHKNPRDHPYHRSLHPMKKLKCENVEPLEISDLQQQFLKSLLSIENKPDAFESDKELACRRSVICSLFPSSRMLEKRILFSKAILTKMLTNWESKYFAKNSSPPFAETLTMDAILTLLLINNEYQSVLEVQAFLLHHLITLDVESSARLMVDLLFLLVRSLSADLFDSMMVKHDSESEKSRLYCIRQLFKNCNGVFKFFYKSFEDYILIQESRISFMDFLSDGPHEWEREDMFTMFYSSFDATMMGAISGKFSLGKMLLLLFCTASSECPEGLQMVEHSLEPLVVKVALHHGSARDTAISVLKTLVDPDQAEFTFMDLSVSISSERFQESFYGVMPSLKDARHHLDVIFNVILDMNRGVFGGLSFELLQDLFKIAVGSSELALLALQCILFVSKYLLQHSKGSYPVLWTDFIDFVCEDSNTFPFFRSLFSHIPTEVSRLDDISVYTFFESIPDTHKSKAALAFSNVFQKILSIDKWSKDIIWYAALLSDQTRNDELVKTLVSSFSCFVLLLRKHEDLDLYMYLREYAKCNSFPYSMRPCRGCSTVKLESSTKDLNDLSEDERFTDNSMLFELNRVQSISFLTVKLEDSSESIRFKACKVFASLSSDAELSFDETDTKHWKLLDGSANWEENGILINFAKPQYAKRIYIEFIEFAEPLDGSSIHPTCPRCNVIVSNRHGICSMCNENVFQCVQCRNINYEHLDAFICNECGQCKSGTLEISIVSCDQYYMDPLSSEEDRAFAISELAQLSMDLDSTMTNLFFMKSEVERDVRKWSSESDEKEQTQKVMAKKTKDNESLLQAMRYTYQATVHIKQRLCEFDGDTALALDTSPESLCVSCLRKNFCDFADALHFTIEAMIEVDFENIAISDLLYLGLHSDASTRKSIWIFIESCAFHPTLSVSTISDIQTSVRCCFPKDSKPDSRSLCLLTPLLIKVLDPSKQISWERRMVVLIESISIACQDSRMSGELVDAFLLPLTRLFMTAMQPQKSLKSSLMRKKFDMMMNSEFKEIEEEKEHSQILPNDLLATLSDLEQGIACDQWNMRLGSQEDSLFRVQRNTLDQWKRKSKIDVSRKLVKDCLRTSSWLTAILFNRFSLPLQTHATDLIYVLLGSTKNLDARSCAVLDYLVNLLPIAKLQGFACVPFFQLLSDLIEIPVVKLYFAAKGGLELSFSIIEEKMEELKKAERNGDSDLSISVVLKCNAELMQELLSEPSIRKVKKSSFLIESFLSVYLDLQSLIRVRSSLLGEASARFLKVIEDFSGESSNDQKFILMLFIKFLTLHRGRRTFLYLLEQIERLTSPMEFHGECLLHLKKAHTQEEFIRGYMDRNPYHSSEIGDGMVTMRDVKNKIVKDLDLMDASEMFELLVRGKLINLDLPLMQVYEKVWKSENGTDDSQMSDDEEFEEDVMVVVYRLQGLDGEATEDVIDSLEEEKKDPEEVYAATKVLAEGNIFEMILSTIAEQLDSNTDLSRLIIQRLISILKNCSNVKSNCDALYRLPELFFGQFMTCYIRLSSDTSANRQMLFILIKILQRAILDDKNVYQIQSNYRATLESVISTILERQEQLKSSSSDESPCKAIALITMNDPSLCMFVIDRFLSSLDWRCLDDSIDEDLIKSLSSEMDTFARISEYISEVPQFDTFKKCALEKQILHSCLQAVSALTGTEKQIKPKAIREIAEQRRSLPFVLRILSALLRNFSSLSELKFEVSTIDALHHLEKISTSSEVGSLSENLLNALCSSSAKLKSLIKSRRSESKDKRKNKALAKREKVLKRMGFKQASSSKLVSHLPTDNFGKLEAANGLRCMVCHEGYSQKPKSMLGMYVYVREEDSEPICGGMSLSCVSHFNLIHYSCHSAAAKADLRLRPPKTQWEGATLRNTFTLCNSMIPILHHTNAIGTYGERVKRFWEDAGLESILSEETLEFVVNIVIDVLSRFGDFSSFSVYSKGGGRHSNMKAFVYIIQMLFYVTHEVLGEKVKDFVDRVSSESSTQFDNLRISMALSLVSMSGQQWNNQKVKILEEMLFSVEGSVKSVIIQWKIIDFFRQSLPHKSSIENLIVVAEDHQEIVTRVESFISALDTDAKTATTARDLVPDLPLDPSAMDRMIE